MNVDHVIGALASHQAGFVGHAQLTDSGLTNSAIKWRVKSGVLQPVHRSLYKVTGVVGSQEQLLRAAMAILPDATVSHESAAEAHDIKFIRRRQKVVTVHSRTTHIFPGVTIHRSLDLAAHHRDQIDGLWTTTPARTLIDLAAVTNPKTLARALDESLAARLVQIDEIQKLFQEVARSGRTGSKLMRKLLSERVGDEMVTASQLEKVGMAVFRDGGLPMPVWQYPAPWDSSRRIDFAWPWCCVGCEADSLRWHSRKANFQNDRNRDNLALIHGWRIFRFTWADFKNRPDFVVTQLRSVLV
ncbi:MAG TPA: hypothetical protein VJQ57_06185 [Acidimicrobiia bacterium]|nr:hypothetical protein [Acidimicrobiia bacterium]